MSTFHTLQNPRNSQIFKTQITMTRWRVNITPWCCTPIIPKQCPYQVLTSYTLWFQRCCPVKILNFKVTMTMWKVKLDHTIMLPTYNPQAMSLSRINFIHLMVSEILPGQNFKCQGHFGTIKSQIKVTSWCYTPNPQPMSLASINFQYFTVAMIQPGQDI